MRPGQRPDAVAPTVSSRPITPGDSARALRSTSTRGARASRPPPRHGAYWQVDLRSPEGQVTVKSWFAGYRHGARVARENGYRDTATITVSASVRDCTPCGCPDRDGAACTVASPEGAPFEIGVSEVIEVPGADEQFKSRPGEAETTDPELAPPDSQSMPAPPEEANSTPLDQAVDSGPSVGSPALPVLRIPSLMEVSADARAAGRLEKLPTEVARSASEPVARLLPSPDPPTGAASFAERLMFPELPVNEAPATALTPSPGNPMPAAQGKSPSPCPRRRSRCRPSAGRTWARCKRCT